MMMSPNPSMSDYKEKVTDIYFKNGGVSKPLVDEIAALTLQYIESLIGEDEHTDKDKDPGYLYYKARNDLRAELRAELRQAIKQTFGGSE